MSEQDKFSLIKNKKQQTQLLGKIPKIDSKINIYFFLLFSEREGQRERIFRSLFFYFFLVKLKSIFLLRNEYTRAFFTFFSDFSKTHTQNTELCKNCLRIQCKFGVAISTVTVAGSISGCTPTHTHID
jgi:hypothetical protein